MNRNPHLGAKHCRKAEPSLYNGEGFTSRYFITYFICFIVVPGRIKIQWVTDLDLFSSLRVVSMIRFSFLDIFMISFWV